MPYGYKRGIGLCDIYPFVPFLNFSSRQPSSQARLVQPLQDRHRQRRQPQGRLLGAAGPVQVLPGGAGCVQLALFHQNPSCNFPANVQAVIQLQQPTGCVPDSLRFSCSPGDGWSPRAEDAILHGCIPVVVMDGVQAVFESILDWDSFSLRIREDDAALEALPQLLASISPERLAHMQRHLARVWHRCAAKGAMSFHAHQQRARLGYSCTGVCLHPRRAPI